MVAGSRADIPDVVMIDRIARAERHYAAGRPAATTLPVISHSAEIAVVVHSRTGRSSGTSEASTTSKSKGET